MFAARNAFITRTTATGVTFNAVNTSVTTTVTIPSHSVGDIIIIAAIRGFTNIPGKPAASGTVPTWTDIGTISAGSVRMSYTVATATNHTSGTWSSAVAMFAVVLSGQHASPIGGYSYGTSGHPVTAPAVTLSKTDGTSQLLHFGFAYTGNTTTTWTSGQDAGYTLRSSVENTLWISRFVTKDVTTTDGAVLLGSNSNGSGNQVSSVEILAA